MKRSTFLGALLALPFVPGVLAKLKPNGASIVCERPPDVRYGCLPPRAKYGLCPGWVPTRTNVFTSNAAFFEDALVYVSAAELARLYGVPLGECVVFKTVPEITSRHYPGVRYETAYEGNEMGLIMLRPRADGDYRLPVITSAEVWAGVPIGMLPGRAL